MRSENACYKEIKLSVKCTSVSIYVDVNIPLKSTTQHIWIKKKLNIFKVWLWLNISYLDFETAVFVKHLVSLGGDRETAKKS